MIGKDRSLLYSRPAAPWFAPTHKGRTFVLSDLVTGVVLMSAHPAVAQLGTASHPRRIAILRGHGRAGVGGGLRDRRRQRRHRVRPRDSPCSMTAYPVIDVVASGLAEAAQGGEAANRLRIQRGAERHRGRRGSPSRPSAQDQIVSAVLAVFGSWAVVVGPHPALQRHPAPPPGLARGADAHRRRLVGDRGRGNLSRPPARTTRASPAWRATRPSAPSCSSSGPSAARTSSLTSDPWRGRTLTPRGRDPAVDRLSDETSQPVRSQTTR